MIKLIGTYLFVCVLYSPLRRITVGMFFAALAFVAAGVVQLQIDVSSTQVPEYL